MQTIIFHLYAGFPLFLEYQLHIMS